MTDEELEFGVSRACKTCKFFPMPCELIEAAQPLVSKREAIAIEQRQRQLRLEAQQRREQSREDYESMADELLKKRQAFAAMPATERAEIEQQNREKIRGLV